MDRIYELLEKRFLSEDEAIELEEKVNDLREYNKVDIEYYGMSGFYLGYNWEIITINDNEYNIYFK